MGGILRTLLAAFVLVLTATTAAQAQWEIEDSHTTASLRGIHTVGGGVAWASGTSGTVLRTEDGGYLWQTCAIPPGAEKLDFRGIQAFDENTAIVMSSGPGDQSRLYKTTDGCQTWKLLFTNPDKDGFWDALVAPSPGDPSSFEVLGDPVAGHFVLRSTQDDGKTWQISQTISSTTGEGAFAASNSSLLDGSLREEDGPILFGTGGPNGARLFYADYSPACMKKQKCSPIFTPIAISAFPKGASAGIFSIAEGENYIVVAVGGDYLKPTDTAGTAAFLTGSRRFKPAQTPPHGYRSAVAYDSNTKTWITVGPNGTDISTDDGRNWRALAPTPQDATDADKNWNALSLPFVVGPHGRIGKLRATALDSPASRRIQTGKP